MCASKENPAKCEMRGVIRFLLAKKLSAADIHCELCAVYGPNIMSEGVVRQWVRFFKDRRTNIHDESRSGRPSVVSADLMKEIDEKFRLLRNFTITQLSEHLPNISRTILYETATGKLGYRKFCARWVPKLLTEIHKTSRMDAALKFLSRYHTVGEDFLNRIVTGDARAHAQNLGSSCQCGDKTTVYGMGSYRFSNPAEESPSNFVSEETNGYRLLGCSRNLAYRIHDTWNNNQFRSLLSHVEETENSHPEQTSRPTEFWGCASADNASPHTAVGTGEHKLSNVSKSGCQVFVYPNSNITGIKTHAGHEGNVMADQLANDAATTLPINLTSQVLQSYPEE
ncbi:hypothetical protein AVEN_200635-1 [Araneus ventricosus]|uniref:Mos1 transposase HTH domain-containing protein n=1 Tax=Araneus ventricosus TaxID=182803 RepID=A0A4Y2RPY8_ARAVE|nr:hypothetical protein AVEN_200635-1 [Araneus ventricosus]